MNYFRKKVLGILTGIAGLFSTIGLHAYNVNLKGGEEIKEAAEIISSLVTLESIKLLAIIVLGFIVAIQGFRLLLHGLNHVITNEQNSYKKGTVLGLIGFLFFFGGIAIIFMNEMGRFFKPTKTVKQHVVQSKKEARCPITDQETSCNTNESINNA